MEKTDENYILDSKKLEKILAYYRDSIDYNDVLDDQTTGTNLDTDLNNYSDNTAKNYFSEISL